MPVVTEALGPGIGSEIRGLDLTRGVDEATAEGLAQLLAERAVLVLRDQRITPEAHLALAEALGPVLTGGPGPAEREPSGATGPAAPGIETWRSDGSFEPEPPFAEISYAAAVPGPGGDTLVADMRAAAATLSAPLRRMLEGLRAEHEAPGRAPWPPASGDADPVPAPAVHPVIARHPESGAPILFVNAAHTTRIRALEPAESAALLGYLTGLAARPRFQLRIRWTPGCLLLRDNWATQTATVADGPPEGRDIRRVILRTSRRSAGFRQSTAA